MAFIEPNEKYDLLLFTEDDVFCARDDIDCSKIVRHGWKKTAVNLEELQFRV